MSKMKRSVGGLVLLGSLGFYGCSTPAPLSETVIFPPHGTLVDASLSYQGEAALMPAFNFYSGKVFRYARRKYGNDEFTNEYPNYQKFGLGLSDSFTHSDDWAVDFAVGYAMLSMDFTARMWGENYFTAQFAVMGGAQFIVQRPVLRTSDDGVTLGGYYRYDRYDTAIWGPDHPFRISSAGIRSSIQFNGSIIPIYGFVESGYSPEFKDILFYIGLTVPAPKIK